MPELVQTIAAAAGVSWASGLNLYGAVLSLGVMGRAGIVDLPPSLAPMMHEWVIGAAAIMYVLEFFADKIPGLDSLWDAVHTFIRIPAGALLAAQAVGEVGEPAQVVAAVLGGSLAGGTHLTKAGTRLLINASPEPFSNIAASTSEDVVVLAGVWAAMSHPLVFAAFLFCFVAAALWALPKLWRKLTRFWRKCLRIIQRLPFL